MSEKKLTDADLDDFLLGATILGTGGGGGKEWGLEMLKSIKELDMNPLLVYEKGARAVDARVIL